MEFTVVESWNYIDDVGHDIRNDRFASWADALRECRRLAAFQRDWMKRSPDVHGPVTGPDITQDMICGVLIPDGYIVTPVHEDVMFYRAFVVPLDGYPVCFTNSDLDAVKRVTEEPEPKTDSDQDTLPTPALENR